MNPARGVSTSASLAATGGPHASQDPPRRGIPPQSGRDPPRQGETRSSGRRAHAGAPAAGCEAPGRPLDLAQIRAGELRAADPDLLPAAHGRDPPRPDRRGARRPADDVRRALPGERLGEIEYEAFLEQGDPEFAWSPPADESAPIALNYTSGTTGRPKGVVYHHRGTFLEGGGAEAAGLRGHDGGRGRGARSPRPGRRPRSSELRHAGPGRRQEHSVASPATPRPTASPCTRGTSSCPASTATGATAW